MTSGFHVTCANKNANGLIVRIGGQGWSLSIHEALVKILSHQLRFNILLGNDYFEIGIRGDGSDAYLVLEPSGKPLHEIAGLPSC